ncbi:MAG: inositol monophosphatase family protein [Anaerolineae bacterium]
MSDSIEQFRAAAVEAAESAGAELMRCWRQYHHIRSKGLRDIVTEADMAAEKAILDIIRRRFPEHDVLTEETGAHGSEGRRSPYRWIIDPLDGTTNYARGLPFFCVSIALFENGRPLLGVIYDPLRRQCYQAARGQGTYLNGERLQVSRRTDWMDLIIATDFPRQEAPRQRMMRIIDRHSHDLGGWRIMGSAALGLCLVADGSADAYLHLTLFPWDKAAAGVIIEEAGGRITGIRGEADWWNTPTCMATNGLIHDALLARLAPDAAEGDDA